ncbi:sensor histidine kinase [Bradyrhizobium iriomotense]|nr:sensor histidine kinase [Bradyrhizobium iriomotense]
MPVKELQHRIRNLLSVVQCIAINTEAKTTDDHRDALTVRLAALSDAYGLIESAHEHHVPLAKLLVRALRPHFTIPDHRIVLSGPDVVLETRLALSLYMIFHELATNATKHGALTSTSGAVEMLWDILPHGGGQALAMQWRESGGPKVRKPRHRGFGMRLISKALSEAQVDLDLLRLALFVAFWPKSTHHRSCE